MAYNTENHGCNFSPSFWSNLKGTIREKFISNFPIRSMWLIMVGVMCLSSSSLIFSPSARSSSVICFKPEYSRKRYNLRPRWALARFYTALPMNPPEASHHARWRYFFQTYATFLFWGIPAGFLSSSPNLCLFWAGSLFLPTYRFQERLLSNYWCCEAQKSLARYVLEKLSVRRMRPVLGCGLHLRKKQR